MRIALLLALLASFARASFGQRGSDHPDSLVVCFSIGEARAIDDSLWARLDERERRAIVMAMLMNRNRALASAEEETAGLRVALKAVRDSEAMWRDREAQAQVQVAVWRDKAAKRGRGGLVGGIVLGSLATYGGIRLLSGR